MLEFFLKREASTEEYTHGTLYNGTSFQSYTLEDPVRAEKIRGETAIPAGHYRIIINHSPKFKRELPLLLKVPNFSGIRIHAGNAATDTEGCILVGTERAPGKVLNSRIALSELIGEIQDALNYGEEVWISIEDSQ